MEQQDKHTKGPWYFINIPNHGPEVVWRLPEKGMVDAPICHLRWSDGLRKEVAETIEADARLIAAAPDMLEALKVAISLWPDDDPLKDKTLEHLRAATNKAKGETA